MVLTGADFKVAKAEVFRIVGRNEPAHRSHGARRNGNPAEKASTKPTKPNGQSRGWREVERYQYLDEAGNLRFEVVRQERGLGVQRKKKFLQRRPDGQGGWIWNLDGVDPLLYRLPELLKRSTETVYLCEGEKCVHTLETWGLLATSNPMGAGNWRSEYSAVLRGHAVVILPDNDEPGRKHVAAVAADLLGVGASVRIVELPGLPAKGDVTDWRDSGGTREELQRLLGEQPVLTGEVLAARRARWELNSERTTGDKPGKEKADVESSFRLADEGVIYFDPAPDKEPLRICGRLEVSALTRNAKGDGWGRLLRWHDSEGRVHEWAMPMSLLAGDGNEYRARLLDGGLFLAPGRKAREMLTVYLQTARPETRALCVARVGWHGENFILPGATIGPEGAEKVLFQTPFDTDHYLNVSGTLSEWRENVGRLCSGNSRLILAASCAFAGPLLHLVGGESGGVHFVGTTSTGKSTALLVGGSVLGGGGLSGFVQSWRTTANGLETVAELHNDLTLFLDELSQIDPREAAETAYLLGNGSGKTRMSRNIGARKKLAWSLLIVSAGEITLADHAQTAGKRTKGGAEVRLINIDSDAGAGMGLFENIHGAPSADAFARQLKDAAKRLYGTPLRAHLEFIAQNRPATEKAVRNFQAEFLKRNVPAGASGEVYRVAQRFALIGAAGELATNAGITGWSPGEATDAAARCLASWIENRGTAGSGDSEAAIRQVRSFLEVNGSAGFRLRKHGSLSVAIRSTKRYLTAPASALRKTARLRST
jgi:uncharacterized protein (DUF927 family)